MCQVRLVLPQDVFVCVSKRRPFSLCSGGRPSGLVLYEETLCGLEFGYIAFLLESKNPLLPVLFYYN
jgi:hypothetical protein